MSVRLTERRPQFDDDDEHTRASMRDEETREVALVFVRREDLEGDGTTCIMPRKPKGTLLFKRRYRNYWEPVLDERLVIQGGAFQNGDGARARISLVSRRLFDFEHLDSNIAHDRRATRKSSHNKVLEMKPQR